MKHLIASFVIAFSSSVLADTVMSVDSLSAGSFADAANGGLAAYATFRVGDSLSPNYPYIVTGDPELLLGISPSAITQTAQYDWPDNWKSSSFSLSFHSADRSLSFYLSSSDQNSRPATGSASLSTVGSFNTLLVEATANVSAMYVSAFSINGISLPYLSPNSYSGTSHFAGFRITGDILKDDFTISGTTYFDGGQQTGDSNRLEFAFAQVSQVPEPETYTLMLAGLGLMGAIYSRRKAKQA